MAKVQSKITGVVSDVTDNHWALESSDFEVIQEEAPKEEVKPVPKPKTKE